MLPLLVLFGCRRRESVQAVAAAATVRIVHIPDGGYQLSQSKPPYGLPQLLPALYNHSTGDPILLAPVLTDRSAFVVTLRNQMACGSVWMVRSSSSYAPHALMVLAQVFFTLLYFIIHRGRLQPGAQPLRLRHLPPPLCDLCPLAVRLLPREVNKITSFDGL